MIKIGLGRGVSLAEVLLVYEELCVGGDGEWRPTLSVSSGHNETGAL